MVCREQINKDIDFSFDEIESLVKENDELMASYSQMPDERVKEQYYKNKEKILAYLVGG